MRMCSWSETSRLQTAGHPVRGEMRIDQLNAELLRSDQKWP